MLTKLRNLSDVGTLIFVTDDTKIKGNKSYDQGNYYEALDIYEQVLACFAWLDFTQPNVRNRIFMDPAFEKEPMAIQGITDSDVEFHERRIINEADREIETETSKKSLYIYRFNRAFNCGQHSAQCCTGLCKYVSF